jgi:hypothetical protein
MAFLNPEAGPGIEFDDLYDAWYKLASLESLYQQAEQELDKTRALYKAQTIIEPTYWPLGKPPTAEWLKQVVHFVGNTPADTEYLSSLEKRLNELRESLTKAKGNLDVLQTRVRIWQTQSANLRKVFAVE